ncbi:MAG: hypothetical protein UT01_C0044G0002 [Candidatus Daviesbacteria bacterium GW2011_GWA1_38_7]|nr:MAG: hypothetical protein UT01_C0044G0002 [Candidatus Daviesbacteria bacterium GW2011_GWA1_38_7]MBS3155128.1 hypothetical protein [Candidatus Woesearchaeota archaeon]
MNNPFITGILHLEDLPEQEVYLRLEENYKNSFLDSAKSLCDGKWTSLGRILNLPISHNNVEILRCFRRTNIYSLKLIKKISKFLIENGFKEYSLDKLEKKIILIKSKQGSPKGILNPKFPINFNSKEGAIIISCLFHDGGITVRDLEPFYTNNSRVLKERFHKAVNNIIGEVDFICKSKSNIQFTYSRIFGLILITIGLIPGKRQLNNPKFPTFVFNYSDELIYEFLSQSIADDGWIYNPKKGFGFIGFNFTIDLTKLSEEERYNVRMTKNLNYLPNTLLGDLDLFKKLGCKVAGPHFGNEIRYTKNSEEYRYTQEWRMQIRGYKNFKFLSKHLNIPLEYKQTRLINENNKIRIRKV